MGLNYAPNITEEQYKELEKTLANYRSESDLNNRIVNSPFYDILLATNIDLGIIVLLKINPETETIDRMALSETELAEKAVKVSSKQFSDIKIPISYHQNLISSVIKSKKYKMTEDWASLFSPALTPNQARLNQTNAGIECSIVHPLSEGDGGALIFSFYQTQASINSEHIDFVTRYSKIVDKALNNFLKKN